MDQIDKKITDDLWALSAIGVRSLDYISIILVNIITLFIYIRYSLFYFIIEMVRRTSSKNLHLVER